MALLIGSVLIAYAQETISSEEAAKFIGWQRTVYGVIADPHSLAESNGRPTFLHLCKP
jgi:hypothetical protein